MRFDENRKVAWAVLAVCVLLSVFALGGGAIGRERAKVVKVFNNGEYTDTDVRHSMDAYLDNAGEAASIMANEAELHLGASDAIDAALKNAGLIGKDDAPLDERSRAYAELKGQVEKLYNSLYNAVDQAGFKNFKLAYDDFWGCDDLLGRDGYHKLARSYNDLISGFPGGIVAGITGNGALATFEG